MLEVSSGDTSAALGVIRREGLCRMRHNDVGMLCVQQKSAERTLEFKKVAGVCNPAVGQTNFVNRDLIDVYSQLCSCDFPASGNKVGLTIHRCEGNHGDDDLKVTYEDGEKVHYMRGAMGDEISAMVGVHGCSKEVKRELQCLIDACGRPDARVWSR